ncbi:MAG: hypothetical protein KBD19_03135 [Candidatus Moranbacteria bacterium]|nr:hypothetical protein [Candidatus Moranbacteria bacterium]
MRGLIQDIERIPKEYFSITDIAKISSLSDGSLWVALSRLVKQKKLSRLARGWYARDIVRVDFEALALDVSSGGYISFESALARYGVLSQQPMAITVATKGPGKSIIAGGREFLYRHLQPKLLWGYRKEGDILVADPEKAFLDLAYLSLNGYAHFDPGEMDTSLLDRKIIDRYLKRIGSSRLTGFIEKIFL